ncbi:MAG: DUF4340 domain-containing protein [Rhizobium sp.]|nr:MAG: DUF4340 domain-containing protein [Rhizobium sp.]
MKRKTLNIALGVAALGLGAAVFLSQKKEEKGPPLTPIAAAALDHVTLEHPGSPTVELERKDGHWKITKPVVVDADPFEVNAFIDLAKLEVKKSLEQKDVSLKELGLDPPAYFVTLNGQKLAFGAQEPIQARRYILANGKVALVDDPPAEALDANYSDLVSRAVVPPGAQIQSIAVPGLTIAKSGDGKSWSLTPDNPDASSDSRQKLIDAWQNAKAMWNAETPREGVKGDAASVTLKDGSVLKFVITERDPQFVMARPDIGVSYTLSRQLLDQMLKLQDKDDTAKTLQPAK